MKKKNHKGYRNIVIKFLATIIVFFITACEASKLPDLQGRYLGTQSLNGNTIQIVSQIPSFVTVNKISSLKFNTYQTVGSSIGSKFEISILNSGDMMLFAPYVFDSSEKGINLKIKNTCASGLENSNEVTMCWSAGKFDLKVENKTDPSRNVIIQLTKKDDLPPLNEVGPKEYSLDELVGRAKFMNYSVTQEAERVFQSKQNISIARGNLLPRLNLKSIIGIFTGDYMSSIGSVLPFLFPSNWFKWKASKEVFQAEKKSFASLRGNEINFVESLFYLQLRDEYVLKRLKKHLDWMKNTQEGLKKEEVIGTIPVGSADYFGTSVALLERDRVGLESLIKTQYAQLSHAVALSPSNGISGLGVFEFPSLTNVTPIDSNEYYKEVQEKSFEIKTLNYLFEASKYLKTEIIFGFLDLEGNGGIGFGTASQIRIAKSQQNEISKKTDETYSLLEQKSFLVATEYNQALDAYRVASSSLSATERRLSWFINRHLNGDGTLDEDAFVDQIVELQFKIMGLIADQATATQVWLMAKSKLDRLLLNGFYKELEVALPEEPLVTLQ